MCKMYTVQHCKPALQRVMNLISNTVIISFILLSLQESLMEIQIKYSVMKLDETWGISDLRLLTQYK